MKRAAEFNIKLEDVSIVSGFVVGNCRKRLWMLNGFRSPLQTHMTFGKEFTTAVEQKQIAQQDAERAKFIVEMVRSISQKS